jgi:hypothetical protein
MKFKEYLKESWVPEYNQLHDLKDEFCDNIDWVIRAGDFILDEKNPLDQRANMVRKYNKVDKFKIDIKDDKKLVDYFIRNYQE